MNEKQVEVSLILCGYNAEETMVKSLDSAMAQTLKSLEILCVNDGSTDKTGEIFRKYPKKDPRFKVIDHPVNKGLLAARQTGVNQASGKYIMFLDLDDQLKPEACEELSKKMNETGYDILQFDTNLVFATEEDRKAREKVMADFFAIKRQEPLKGSDAILDSCFLKGEFTWNVWSKIYRAELAKKVYSYVPEKPKVVMAEDTFAFFVAASLAKSLGFVQKKYYFYSVGAGVSGSNNDPKYEERSVEVYSALINPYSVKNSTDTGRQVADKLGKHFRFCLACRLQQAGMMGIFKDTVEREIRNFGPDMAAQTFSENWDKLGMHPLKTVFLGQGSGFPTNPVEKIRKVGVIDCGTELNPGLLELIGALRSAGCEIRFFGKSDLTQANEKKLAECQIEVLPDDMESAIAFFSRIAASKKDDAYILTYGRNQDMDLTAYLLFLLRFAAKGLVFAYLEKEFQDLNCYDKIYLSAADCVLSSKPETAPLFGDLGIIGGKDLPAKLAKVKAAFERSPNGQVSKEAAAVRKLMSATSDAAMTKLGFVGYGNNRPLDKAEVEKKIAAAGYPTVWEDYRLLRESGYFDDDYYRKQFPGTVIEDTVMHYCQTGMETLAAPSVIFDPKQYCLGNPDLYAVRLKMNLAAHYLAHGIAEGRKVFSPIYSFIRDSGYFDEKQYREKHGIELGHLDPLTHYILEGWKKGYLPSDRFVDKYYCELYFEFVGTDFNPLYHYVRWGKKEGRCPFPLKPRQQAFFPEGFDQEAFWQRKGKYLIVSHQLDFTGVPILCKMAANIFSGEKSVAILSPMDGPLRDACLKEGIPVLIDSDFYIHKERASFYKEKGFGVCLFNTLGVMNPYLRTASIIPSILWIHDNLPKSYLPEPMQKKILYAPTVFATSKTTIAVVKEYNPGVRYLPYPVKDMGSHAKERKPAKIRFGVFGVYNERKGQDLAIEAFKGLPAALKAKAELLLIGNPSLSEYAEKLESLAAGEKNIRFVPPKKDPVSYHQLYEDLEVQVCPSRTDPMPLVVFDGMMHGCPEILSDTVGQSEFIRQGENGFVFPAEDAAALRKCMSQIIENPDRFAKMSQASRQTFLDQFEFSKASGVIRRVLDEVKGYL